MEIGRNLGDQMRRVSVLSQPVEEQFGVARVDDRVAFYIPKRIGRHPLKRKNQLSQVTDEGA